MLQTVGGMVDLLSDISSLRVLVAEDDEQLRHFLELKFGLDGFEVQSASDGIEALSLLQIFDADVLVCDIMMPRMSGLTVCKEIRSNGQNRMLPVILLTARSIDEDIEEVLRLGKITYLAKPFDATSLANAVRDAAESAGGKRALLGHPHPAIPPTSWLHNLGKKPSNVSGEKRV
ncbi:MAG: response regulator [Candidatus Dormibacteria bacterium]